MLIDKLDWNLKIDWDLCYKIAKKLESFKTKAEKKKFIDDKSKTLDAKQRKNFILHIEAIPYCYEHIIQPHQRVFEYFDKGYEKIALIHARGLGKTKASSEFVKECVYRKLTLPQNPILVIGPTFSSIKENQIVGDSGIVAAFPHCHRPKFNSSSLTLEFHNGLRARLFSAENAQSLRGVNASIVVCDEVAAFTPSTIEEINSQISIITRKARPKILISTTPQSISIQHQRFFKSLFAAHENPKLKTYVSKVAAVKPDGNPVNKYISKAYLDKTMLELKLDRGEAFMRQEMFAEFSDDNTIQLFPQSLINRSRSAYPDSYDKIVVACDPAASDKINNDETGIVAVGLKDGHCYVLADLSGHYTPEDWSYTTINLHNQLNADCIVIEKNCGGDISVDCIRSRSKTVFIETVVAKKGKIARADPVSNLYSLGLVHHPIDPNMFPTLENQMSLFPSKGIHDDRLDALVYAISSLMIDNPQERQEILGNVIL